MILKNWSAILALLVLGDIKCWAQSSSVESDLSIKMYDLHRHHFEIETTEVMKYLGELTQTKIGKQKFSEMLDQTPWWGDLNKTQIQEAIIKSDFQEFSVKSVGQKIFVDSQSEIATINAFEGIFQIDGKIINLYDYKSFASLGLSIQSSQFKTYVVAGFLAQKINDKYGLNSCEKYRLEVFSQIRDEIYTEKDKCFASKEMPSDESLQKQIRRELASVKESTFRRSDGEKIVQMKNLHSDSPLCLQVTTRYHCFDKSERIYFCQALDNLRSCISSIVNKN